MLAVSVTVHDGSFVVKMLYCTKLFQTEMTLTSPGSGKGPGERARGVEFSAAGGGVIVRETNLWASVTLHGHSSSCASHIIFYHFITEFERQNLSARM